VRREAQFRQPRIIHIGPYEMSILDIALSASVLLHLVVGSVLLVSWAMGWRISPPRIDYTRGEQVTEVELKVLSNEQLRELLEPQLNEAVRPAPIEAPDQPLLEHAPQHVSMLLPVVDVTPDPLDADLPEPVDPTPTDLTAPQPEPAEARPAEPAPTAHDPPAPRPAPQPVVKRPGVRTAATITQLPQPRYPAISRRNGEQGLVVVEVLIDANGRARDTRVLQDPGHPRLVRAVLEAVRQARFRPATLDGTPIAQRVRIPYRFVLQD
jgi:protein TonB